MSDLCPIDGLTVRNARIVSTHLGPEGHGILTGFVQLDYGDSSGQGFGNYNLGAGQEMQRFVKGCLLAADAENWESLKGKMVRALIDSSDRVCGLMHVISDNKRFRM